MLNRWICRREPWLVALLAVAMWAWSAAARAERRALLVGCTRYPHIADGLQLVGPANDVRLLRDLLTKDYDFKRLCVISRGSGKRIAVAYLPSAQCTPCTFVVGPHRSEFGLSNSPISGWEIPAKGDANLM